MDNYDGLLKDIRLKLRERYGNAYPEFTSARVHLGYWQVWVLNRGWMRTSDILRRQP